MAGESTDLAAGEHFVLHVDAHTTGLFIYYRSLIRAHFYLCRVLDRIDPDQTAKALTGM